MDVIARKMKQVQNSTTSQDSLVRNIMNAYQNRSPAEQNANISASKTQNTPANEQNHAFENTVVR